MLIRRCCSRVLLVARCLLVLGRFRMLLIRVVLFRSVVL